MASISRTTNDKGQTLRTVQFRGLDGKRRSIRHKVALLETYARHDRAPDRDTAAWLGRIDDAIYDKLAAGGLIEPRPSAQPVQAKRTTLAAFLDSYIAKRSDVKRSTAVVFGHTRRCLVEYFGADKQLAEITPADADD